MNIFVYGTLKVGGPLASSFDDSRVSSEKAVLRGYDMYDIGNFPGIVPGEGAVSGELHKYKGKLVRGIMDSIEGYYADAPEKSLYLRREVEVETENGSQTAFVYVFNKNISGRKKIASGQWRK